MTQGCIRKGAAMNGARKALCGGNRVSNNPLSDFITRNRRRMNFEKKLLA